MEKKIYKKTLKLLGNKGVKFTTEDLAKELGTSKRTIYSYFASKDEIIEKTIDFVFNEIMALDAEILEDSTLTLQQKIKLYFENIPYAYNLSAIIRHIDDFQRYYPDLCEKVNNNINILWDPILKLIEKGIKDNEFEEINTTVFKLMLKETLKKLLDFEFLSKNQISFENGIKSMNNIILYGLVKRKDD
ncbi:MULTISPECIES: TetR/AcrR family transcriptional regulator [Clostridium]|uniref:TetR/AcrR family transcriptional regulator n=1 Tax=Clostridium cibarium TaxID=2762247 RepID=A0ABR8PUA6_9CLOT|nr:MULTISPECIES: TetR/AcrR family transcriptional regulator [Clostridium]MBD7911763.1 TetR/AcrR family transcriptional regulator [Clostridium cibarium]